MERLIYIIVVHGDLISYLNYGNQAFIYFQALEKQKRKTEEEQRCVAEVKRELQSVNESICDLDKKRIKLEHDIQVKDQHVSCIESQLAHTKALLDTDSKKVFIGNLIQQFAGPIAKSIYVVLRI